MADTLPPADEEKTDYLVHNTSNIKINGTDIEDKTIMIGDSYLKEAIKKEEFMYSSMMCDLERCE